MKKFMLLLLLSAMLSGLSACNTMEGLGKDVKSAGNSLENAADRHK